ncbi:NAD-dependent succinate-semialdehyde dehydrogenase [Winogradskyella sp.]|uniref:NAD-dependent succinate-semialdehyde dehydrogenase n=1 Tax=Winogradskyella sp. TaxID=1883156 RepID=UPI001B2D420E|nr:NAD-dependent succinate-semialdehyde dehydrogenase [Winogradskyella sp.]MBO6880484.1 NAD-dependent succinate-semialdehyde dehydrogenase [Winogradskyella sp.]
MSDTINTYNPYNGEHIKTYKLDSKVVLNKKLELAKATFKSWKLLEISERAKLLQKLADELLADKDSLSKLITLEMGKPIIESKAEIEKCAFLIQFYAHNADQFLADAIIETDAHESYISYDPLGCILAVMPWNYPFWQVFRFAIPTLIAGNVALLKHASNVTGCAIAIEKLFNKSGFPEGCFQTLLADHDTIEEIIGNDIVKAVTLTGSEKAGKSIAQTAGKHLKKTVLELGGNNACIILKDADLDKHLDTIVKARMQNSGQSCIAAKRFLVEEEIYDEFLEQFTKKVKALNYDDPLKEDTNMSCLARPDLADILEEQVSKSVEKGAKVHYGITRDDAYYQPTILTNVTEDMPVFKEETFGPVAPIIKVKNLDEAIAMASNSRFGLGTMIFTKDYKKASKKVLAIEDGAYFINEMVKSDPRLPFGGTKASGYGRELSKEGILEFVNKKTIFINK